MAKKICNSKGPGDAIRVFQLLIVAAVSYCLMALVSACTQETPASPDVLRIGVLPDESVDTLRDRYQPLDDYLEDKLAQEVRIVVPDSYSHLVELFGANEVDLAFFGGVTFVIAETKHQAMPLVMRDIDIEFSTYFIAQDDTPGTELQDFQGQRIIFGSRLSTSGHLMPRFYLQEQRIEPETFFSSVSHADNHNQTAAAVVRGDAELGAVNSKIFDRMLSSGRIGADELRIVSQTPDYADYVWAAQADWSTDYTDRVRDAFLELSWTKIEHREVLLGVGAGGFLPALQGDFEQLRHIMSENAALWLVDDDGRR